MAVSPQHAMVLEGAQVSGAEEAEEWVCPDCGRRLVLRWFPSYAKVILARGDERVIHSGAASGGIRIDWLAVTPTA